MHRIILVEGFCPHKINIIQFPDWFRRTTSLYHFVGEIITSGTFDPGLSDHCPVYGIIKLQCKRTPPKYISASLVPRRSLLTRCPREVWERAGERTPSQYWQNTPDFSAILPLVTFYEFLQLHFGKTARR